MCRAAILRCAQDDSFFAVVFLLVVEVVVFLAVARAVVFLAVPRLAVVEDVRRVVLAFVARLVGAFCDTPPSLADCLREARRGDAPF